MAGRFLNALWYGPRWRAWPLVPLSGLFRAAAAIRRSLYHGGLRRVFRAPIPVVVVGNLSVGGTGKSPLVVRLAELLRQEGWRPGVVLRGYGGRARTWPRRVGPGDDAALVGDEAVMLARRCQCPVVAGPDRSAGVRLLLDQPETVDVVLCDDGLQHYALARDIEVVVVDGRRGWGNGYCLPAGPLREPRSRLRKVDFVVVTGATGGVVAGHRMALVQRDPVHLSDGRRGALGDFAGRSVHAVAGIGNPARFFRQLTGSGLRIVPHPFRDHYAFRPEDIRFGDGREVVMTEKDAVKCLAFAGPEHWYVPVDAVPAPEFEAALLQRLNGLRGRPGQARCRPPKSLHR